MNKARRTNPKWLEESPQPTQEVQDNPEMVLASLSQKELDVLNCIIEGKNKYVVYYASQTLIGLAVGTDRSEANRTIRKLERAGFIASNYRHMKTCLYKVSEFFYNPHIRSKLVHLLPALRLLPIIFSGSLLLAMNQCYLFERTQSNIKLVRNNKVTVNGCKNILNGYFKGMSLNMFGVNPISVAVQNISKNDEIKLKLTLAGEINLCMFPDFVINHAVEQLRQSKTDKYNVYNWFFTVCYEYCQKNNVTLRWNVYYALKEYQPAMRAERTPENGKTTPKIYKPVMPPPRKTLEELRNDPKYIEFAQGQNKEDVKYVLED